MNFMRGSTSPFISEEIINKMVSVLAEQIEQDYEGEELVLIMPLKGSVLFGIDLMRKISIPVEIDFVQLSSHKNEEVKILKDISLSVTNRHILIVKEIIQEGRTLAFLKERLFANKPASLKIVTLLDKPMRRKASLRPDYVGKVIHDRYVVGYGMDNNELCRNYKDISTLKQ